MLVVCNRIRPSVSSLRLVTDVNQKGTFDIALMGIGPFAILLIRLPPVLRLLAMAMTFIGDADTVLHLFVGLYDVAVRLGGLLVDTITELRATTASAFMVMLAVSSAKAVKAKTGPKIIATTTWVPGEARSRPV